MLKHVVMWKLKDNAEGADKATNAQKVKEALEALRGRIPGLQALEVGMNAIPSADSYDLVLYTEFESVDALSTYQVHPEHKKAVAFIGRVQSERALVDYVPDEGTRR